MRGLRGVRGWWTENKALVRNCVRVAYWGPLAVGFAVMVFFAVIPQSREVYLGIIEDRRVVQGVLSLALVVLLCGLLDFWQWMLSTAAIDRIYPEHADPRVDRFLLRFRDWVCRICSLGWHSDCSSSSSMSGRCTTICRRRCNPLAMCGCGNFRKLLKHWDGSRSSSCSLSWPAAH
jgi:hypothetical protein